MIEDTGITVPTSGVPTMNDNENYDVVIDTLQKQYDALWKMTQRNMNADLFNIMDQIRLEQCDQLRQAMALWRKHKEQPGIDK